MRPVDHNRADLNDFNKRSPTLSGLNVGACWLSYEKEHLSFDEGIRVESFHQFKSSDQFAEDARLVADQAKVKLRDRSPSRIWPSCLPHSPRAFTECAVLVRRRQQTHRSIWFLICHRRHRR